MLGHAPQSRLVESQESCCWSEVSYQSVKHQIANPMSKMPCLQKLLPLPRYFQVPSIAVSELSKEVKEGYPLGVTYTWMISS